MSLRLLALRLDESEWGQAEPGRGICLGRSQVEGSDPPPPLPTPPDTTAVNGPGGSWSPWRLKKNQIQKTEQTAAVSWIQLGTGWVQDAEEEN